jgi:plastocyanin
MAGTGRHSLRIFVVTIASVIGLGAVGLLLAGLTPAARATLTSARVPVATGASIMIKDGTCSGGGTEFCFSPESVTIAVGTAVVWTNETGINHTTSSCTSSACPGAPANTGSQTFSNPIGAAKGSTESVTFTSAGTYTYYCMIHGYIAMHGTITVTGAAAMPKISKFTPKSGPVGTKVTITGKNLALATAVTFNGTAAVITSDTATKIVVKVPAGATTGKIEVTDAGGTAMSASVFKVT